jgi:RNA polymerase sigma-70 factor, ECF subfamily
MLFEANTDFCELASLLHAGDSDAYAIVINAVGEVIIDHLMGLGFGREDAEEISGDCFLKLWATRCNSYDPRRSAFVPWVLTIARHLAIDRIRRSQSVRFVALTEAEDTADPNPIDKKYSGRYDYELVEHALSSLENNHQDVIDLRFGHDLTYAEISEILGKSSPAVCMDLRRAINRLRIEVERLNRDDTRRRNHQSRSPDSS